jgi:hypothetical protein
MYQWSTSLIVGFLGLLLSVGTVNGQILTLGDPPHPLVPSWGNGTLLRANDALPVYVVEGSQIRTIQSPNTLRSCFDVHNIIWVFSQALHQTGVSSGPKLTGNLTGGLCPNSAAHSIGGFQELYESDGARHVGMTAWTSADKTKVQGIIRWESDSDVKGVCGGAVVTLLDEKGALLDYYTPPTGCVGSKAEGLSSHAVQRFEPWEDSIKPQYRDRVQFVRIGVIFTNGNDKLGNFIPTLEAAAKFVGTVISDFVGGNKDGDN